MAVKETSQPQVLVIINPVAGFLNVAVSKRIITNHFKRAGWYVHFYLTEKDTDFTSLIKSYLDKGISLIVVVGGDGTIASVAAGMAHSSVPLGIIPAGTWNAIARHLMLPLNPILALALITGKHQVRYLDLMSIGETVHAMNLGVGFSAKMIKSSTRESKRLFGMLAYFRNIIKQAFGLELTRYQIEADGKVYHGKASEIFVANYGVVGLNVIESLLDIHPNDGKADVLIFKPRTILDLPAVFWQALILRKKRGPKFQQLQASRSITIQTTPPMDVQADGEFIGQTPVTVTVLQQSVCVIVPDLPLR